MFFVGVEHRPRGEQFQEVLKNKVSNSGSKTGADVARAT